MAVKIRQVRLQHARMLLMNTEQRIADIALRCGFRESNYFCRWISRHTGLPPRDLIAGGLFQVHYPLSPLSVFSLVSSERHPTWRESPNQK